MEESVLSVWDNTSSGKDGRLQLVQYLSSHRSTVTSTAMTWLGTSRVMLSVGKDRQLSFWRLRDDRKYESLAVFPKAHSRVIWDCCAVFDHSVKVKAGEDEGEGEEMAIFATASRDGLVRLFGVAASGNVMVGDIDLIG